MNLDETIYKNLEKNYTKKVIRNLKNIRKLFLDQDAVKIILKEKNPKIYEVFIKKAGKLCIALTIIKPGTIGKEYYFTKGHKHKQKIKEYYILTEGKGKLLIQNKTTKIIELKKDKMVVVPKNSAHRLINTGDESLKVLTIYASTSGHVYNTKFKKRIFKR